MKKTALVLVLAAHLAACSPSPDAVPVMDTGAIKTLDLQTQAQAGVSQWDGVIEAVQQADLSAQTAGRVSAVLVDVNDAVQPNQLLLRLTGVEQQAGRWTIVKPSRWARRITANTPMALGGPAAGHALMQTAADPAGRPPGKLYDGTVTVI